MLFRYGVSLALACAVLGGAAPARAVIDVVGSTSATLAWAPSSGDPEGYVVWLSANGDERYFAGTAATNQATVEGSFGDTIVVSITAWRDGEMSDFSQDSEAIRFVEVVGEEPPPDDGGGGDPGGTPPIDGGEPDFGADLTFLRMLHEETGELRVWSLDGAELVAQHLFLTLPIQLGIAANADFDGDGDDDLLLRHTTSGAYQIWWIDGVDLLGQTHMPALPTTARIVGAGHFDANDVADLILETNGRHEIWLLSAGGAIGEKRTLWGQPPSAVNVAALPDLEGDGNNDVVFRRLSDGRLNSGLVRNGFVVTYQTVTALEPSWGVEGKLDADGDGDDDLLVRADDGELMVAVLENRTLAGWSDLPYGPALEVGGAADLDRDGTDDLVVSTAIGGFGAFLLQDSAVRRSGDLGAMGEGWSVLPSPGAR